MAGTTVDILSQILRDVYMGPARIEAVKVQAWTCSKHRRPKYDQYKEVCLAAEALGVTCENLSECPHVVSRKIKNGCPECKTARWADVLDYDTIKIDETGFVYGDAVYVAKLFTTMQWELEQSMLLLREDMSRTHYGDTPKAVIPLHRGGQ